MQATLAAPIGDGLALDRDDRPPHWGVNPRRPFGAPISEIYDLQEFGIAPARPAT
jgi:hypothetical protein